MTTLRIRDLDEQTLARLRVRAARHGRSVEDEVADLLRRALDPAHDQDRDLGAAIHGRFRRLGGIALRLPARGPVRQPPRPRR
jgi:plasmid stability protein